MATTKTTEKVAETAYNPDELVSYKAPIDRYNKADIFVSVNGESLLIKRGVTVEIKRKFYDVLMNQEAMDSLALERQIAAEEQSAF